jgi:hypothetical protein
MADTKISALPAATTPLAGTEVLPIVQGGVTEKVAVDDLTVKNVRSNATSGILQVTGPGAGTTRVMTVPDASFTAARTDAAQSFTGNQTLSDGNLVIGTSGKGIDFSATPGTGTSELLADYEEGTWTPIVVGKTTAGTGTYSTQSGFYTKMGNMVTFSAILGWSAHTGTGNIQIQGLPFAITNGNYRAAYPIIAETLTYVGELVAINAGSNTYIDLLQQVSASGLTGVSMDTNVGYMVISGSYLIN